MYFEFAFVLRNHVFISTDGKTDRYARHSCPCLICTLGLLLMCLKQVRAGQRLHKSRRCPSKIKKSEEGKAFHVPKVETFRPGGTSLSGGGHVEGRAIFNNEKHLKMKRPSPECHPSNAPCVLVSVSHFHPTSSSRISGCDLSRQNSVRASGVVSFPRKLQKKRASALLLATTTGGCF